MGGKPRSSVAEFPFLYLNHGPLNLDSIGRCDGAYLGFAGPVPEAMKRRIRDACPEPIRGTASFLDNLLSIESPDDSYGFDIIEVYGSDTEKAQDSGWPEISQATADRFTAAVEEWVAQVHSMCPLVFVMGPGNTDLEDPWNRHSKKNFCSVFIPFIDSFLARNPSVSADEDEDGEEEDEDEDISRLRHGHIACLLQEFEPEFDLEVPQALEARVAELCDQFDL